MRALTIALCLLATPALAETAGASTVIDGDTSEVHGQRIRLHGIDAPETRQLCLCLLLILSAAESLGFPTNVSQCEQSVRVR